MTTAEYIYPKPLFAWLMECLTSTSRSNDCNSSIAAFRFAEYSLASQAFTTFVILIFPTCSPPFLMIYRNNRRYSIEILFRFYSLIALRELSIMFINRISLSAKPLQILHARKTFLRFQHLLKRVVQCIPGLVIFPIF